MEQLSDGPLVTASRKTIQKKTSMSIIKTLCDVPVFFSSNRLWRCRSMIRREEEGPVRQFRAGFKQAPAFSGGGLLFRRHVERLLSLLCPQLTAPYQKVKH
jgi:hypothetical protein